MNLNGSEEKMSKELKLNDKLKSPKTFLESFKRKYS